MSERNDNLKLTPVRVNLHRMMEKYKLPQTLYQLIVETTVSEQASRRNAMDNANDNADELISTLTLEYNKARQAAITAEITEVVSSSINK